MIKNMTRKGLAIGATAALTLAGLVGFAAPAQASNLTVLPTAGTSTSFVSGETFKVKVIGQSFATTDALRWEIVNPDQAALTIAATGGGAASPSSSSAATVTVTPAGVLTTPGGNELHLTVAATVATTLQVRAYIESGDAAGFTGLDTVFSAQVPVSFVKPADVTTTTTITQPIQGDTAVTASLSFNGINNEQLSAAKVGVNFTKGDGSTFYPNASVTAAVADSGTITYTAANNFVAGQSVTITGLNEAGFNLTSATIATASATNFTVTNALADATATGTGTAVASAIKSNSTWSATDAFKFVSFAVPALAKDTAVRVQPLFRTSGAITAADTIGTAATAMVLTRQAATIAAETVVSTTANVGNQSLLNSTFQVKAVVKDGATTPAAVAGAAVTATVATNATLSGTAGSVVSLGVNGVTYTTNASLPGTGNVAKVALVTNANGEAVVTLSTAGFTAGQTVTVTFGTENLSAAVTNTQVAASYTVTHRGFVTTTDGAAVSVPVVVYDQFGGRPANNYDVRALFTGSTQATTASTSATSTNVALVGGAATLSIVDNGVGLGVNSYNVTVVERAAGGGFGAALNGTGTTTLDVHVKSAASLVAGSVTATGTLTNGVYVIAGPVALSLVDTANYDSTTVIGTAPTSFTGALTAQVVTGTVSTTASPTLAATAVPGAAVTLSGAGLQFSDGGKYSAGSITVIANTSGVYTASVYSNKAGKQTVTVTSGSASATVEITFAEAGSQTGANVVVDAPASVLPGSTLSVTVKVTDKFGNPVNTTPGAANLQITYAGPGLVVGSGVGAIATNTNAAGEITFTVMLGSNDSGTATVTARHRLGATDTTDDVIVQKSVVIGAVAAEGARGWTRFLSATNELKIYARDVVGAGKVQFMVNGRELAWIRAVDATDPKLNVMNDGMVRSVFVRDMLVGRNVIEIYVDGVRLDRRIFTR